MHTQQEIKEDLDKFHDLIESLKVKYGPEFSCAVAIGSGVNSEITSEDDPDSYAGAVCVVGNEAMFHQACHCLLKSCKFIDGIIDAMKCTIIHEHRKNNKSELLDMMMTTSLESLKKILITSTDEFKEEEENKRIDNAIDQLLRNSGFKN